MCTNLMYAFRLKRKFDTKFQKTGIRSKIYVTFSVRSVHTGERTLPIASFPLDKYDLIKIPCGQCIECRLKKSKQKALQAVCESQICDERGTGSSFITLTFGDEETYNYLRTQRKLSRYKAKNYTKFLTWTLENREFPLFMKRLRKAISKEYPELKEKFDVSVRFFHVGEYGSQHFRPHHHAIIFNFDFPDKELFSIDKKTGVRYYRSKLLEKCWRFGFSLISEVNYNTCAYVSRYCTKKITGEYKDEYYYDRKPEYTSSSNRRGIGFDWFIKYGRDVLSTDSLSHTGRAGKRYSSKPPKYFDNLVKTYNLDLYNDIVDLREFAALKNSKEENAASSPVRMDGREKLNLIKLNRLVRSFEMSEYNNITQDEFHRKANAFGISDAMLDSQTDYIKGYLKNKNYRSYEPHSTNKKVLELYKRFESARRKYDFMKEIKNPNTCKKRGKMLYSESIFDLSQKE